MKKEEYDFYDRTSLKAYNLDRTMQDQLRALDNLDVFTRKHCENVAALTCRICEYLGCSKGFTEYCTICAYMHDIGKLFIPAQVLQKPGKLTEEEYETIKTHTTIGYKMCIRDERLRPYAAGCLYHHEALDGSGYPSGLTKKDIPYEAQIIRVADEYDAIVSKRQYKSHIGISDTLKIIIENTKNHQNLQSSAVAKELISNAKSGKDNPLIVRALLKVIIDDISYEIFCTQNYVESLQSHINRLKKVEKYHKDMQNAKSENKKQYFYEYIKMYLQDGETSENYQTIKQEYIDAYNIRKKNIENLYKEIKIIKKLKV